MILRTDTLPWPVSGKLRNLIQAELEKANVPPGSGGILNFKDPTYSATSGGYHPVEIAISADGRIQYITDFHFVGRPPQVELAKELDFDFSLQRFQHFDRDYPIQAGREMFSLWQSNFLAYQGMGVYTVTVQTDN